MPLNLTDDSPKTFPNPQYLTLDNFKRGVITLIDKSRLPKNALEEADNIFLYEDGMPGPRPGVNWYGSVSPNAAAVQGFDYFDFDGVIHLVMVAGGNVYRSTDDGTNWTICTGATMDTTAKVQMNQYNSFLYLTDGITDITRYDGTTTLLQYSALSTPSAPSTGKTGLGTAGSYNYYYKVAAVNEVGFSAASAKNTGTAVSSNLPRTSWDTSNYITLTTPNGAVGQTRWDIYVSEDDSNYYYLASAAATAGAATAWIDRGADIVVPSTTAPTESTAAGPLVEELVNVGSRMYGVRDTDNKYRIWFTTGSPPYGAFSTAYGGGYLDWSPGGKYIPVKVEDYRDGKNTPVATVWCKSADGQGCILQMTLSEYTVGDITVIIPTAIKLPGSRGTPAPGSVVNVLNDYYFYNSQAFYNLGSRAQFLNLLSTDEASANIRPTIKQITTAGEPYIASCYYDAKVYFSVPYGEATNTHTAVYDTEQKAWLPTAFDIGFNKFLRYVDTSGTPHLLAYKPGDTRLSEISTSIQGDYGEPFATSLYTGLYPVTKNRFEFQWTEEAELELSNPQGEISFELLGIERTRGFRSSKSATVETTLTNQGWSVFGWSTTQWSDTSEVPDTFSESSVKRYFNVQRELNAVQWHITTNSLNARYVLRTLQTSGTPTQSGKPASWRIR
jgi:hypothetical protein